MNEEQQPVNVAEPEDDANAEPDTAAEELTPAKAEEYLAALQRERADFLNYKRRIEQEGRMVASTAAALAIERILPVLDDLTLATASVDPSIASLPWTQGVLAVQRKFEAALDALGVKPLDVEGKPFDPRVCEALMEAEGPENTVVQVLQRGYAMGEQLIRPARVIVGRGGGTQPQEEEQISEA